MDCDLLASRIRDAIRLCDTSSFPKFVGFLRPEETETVFSVLQSIPTKQAFFGGYEDAERVFFGAFPEWCEETEAFFPISSLTFTFRPCDNLSHRDFLGTFMSLGIARETVGDILIEKGRAVAFFADPQADFVAGQVEKVGGVGVNITKGHILPLPGMGSFQENTDTVASMRLDCVVAALLSCSRNAAVEFIESKIVSVNSVCTEKTTKFVQAGDKITIRGKGKFLIEDVSGPTKKDRLIIKYKKFI